MAAAGLEHQSATAANPELSHLAPALKWQVAEGVKEEDLDGGSRAPQSQHHGQHPALGSGSCQRIFHLNRGSEAIGPVTQNRRESSCSAEKVQMLYLEPLSQFAGHSFQYFNPSFTSVPAATSPSSSPSSA
ncbi:unnamed protein product [Pleuronectes platessa]|uniref:Uncharacterized protein n=1 Tax=Pleuronectes platessa TaxID=8262 RepID=A0A9N7ZBA3_PLEPL|nr:unnamed protein product [Pleuronectes platessa]